MRIDIDPYDLRIGEKSTELEGPVEPYPCGHNDIGLRETQHHTGESCVHHGQVMVVWQDTSTVVNEQEWNSRLLYEGLQIIITGAEAHTASSDEKRFLCAVDEIGCLFQRLVISADRELLPAPGRRGSDLFRGLDIEYIGRDFEEYRTRPALHGIAESHGQVFRDAFGIIASATPLDHWFDHVHLVHFLQGPFEVIPEGGPAAKHHQRSIVQIGINQTGECIGEPRACCDQTHPRLSRVDGPRVGHHGGSLFVADIDGPDSVLGEPIQYLLDMSSRQGEHRSYLLNLFQIFRHQMAAVYLCHDILLLVINNEILRKDSSRFSDVPIY